MKFRTDFVTNSSSSSFILVSVKSNKFLEILENNEAFLNSKAGKYLDINKKNKTVIYEEDEGGFYDIYVAKNTLESLVDSIIDFYENEFGWFLEGEEYEFKNQFVKDLKDNKKELMENIDEINFNFGHCGWGEDEYRFEENWYEKDSLKYIYKNLAEQHNCSIDEVTDEMFNDYVLFESSLEENKIHYNKNTGKVTRSRSAGLL